MEGLLSEDQSFFGSGRLFGCARQQQNNAQDQDRYDHSTAPEAESNSRLM
jgi:hypothetical protein